MKASDAALRLSAPEQERLRWIRHLKRMDEEYREIGNRINLLEPYHSFAKADLLTKAERRTLTSALALSVLLSVSVVDSDRLIMLRSEMDCVGLM